MRKCKQEKHNITNNADIVVEDIGYLVLADHDHSLDDGREKESKTVDDGQAFKTQHVLYFKFSLLLGLESEIDHNAHLGDHQEQGYCCLNYQSKLLKLLVCCIIAFFGQECFKLGELEI